MSSWLRKFKRYLIYCIPEVLLTFLLADRILRQLLHLLAPIANARSRYFAAREVAVRCPSVFVAEAAEAAGAVVSVSAD